MTFIYLCDPLLIITADNRGFTVFGTFQIIMHILAFFEI
jgi:hypothetical protein